MSKRLIDKTIVKFLVVGIINTLIGSGTMFLLYNLASCSYWVSSASNYIVGSIVSFFLNKYFTFQNKLWSWVQVGKFIVNTVVCYLIGYGLAKMFVLWIMSNQPLHIQENLAMVLGMCFYTGLNYFGQRFYAFQESGTTKKNGQ